MCVVTRVDMEGNGDTSSRKGVKKFMITTERSEGVLFECIP